MFGVPQPSLSLTALSADQLVKWYQGNEIWALAVVDVAPPRAEDNLPQLVADLLLEFKDIFGNLESSHLLEAMII